MNRTILFDSPFLLGFEHTRSLIERAAKAAAESYPPDNVEDAGDGRLRISLAVAGFSPDQLHVVVEDNQLTVAGRKDGDGKDADDRAFLHRGARLPANLRPRRRPSGQRRGAGARSAPHRSRAARTGQEDEADTHKDGWLNRAAVR